MGRGGRVPWCHWEIPAWPWHNHAQQIYPLKPSQKHWSGLLSDQQKAQKCMMQKTTLLGPWLEQALTQHYRYAAALEGRGSSMQEKPSLRFAVHPSEKVYSGVPGTEIYSGLKCFSWAPTCLQNQNLFHLHHNLKWLWSFITDTLKENPLAEFKQFS